MGLIPRLSELTNPEHATESSHIACMSVPRMPVLTPEEALVNGNPPLGSTKVWTLYPEEYPRVPT